MKKEEGSILTIKDLEYISRILSGNKVRNDKGIVLWKVIDGSLKQYRVKTKKDLLKVIKNKQ